MMSKRLFWIVVALVAMGCVTAAWVQAETVRDGATLAGALVQAPQQQPTIPAPPDYVTASLDVLPLQFCPGYKLTYTFRLTNTSESDVVAQLTVRDDLPANTWFNTDEANTHISGSIPGAYHQYYDEDEEVWHRWVEWQGTNIGPGEVVIARVVLHPFTTWQNGAVLRNTFAYVVDGFRREEWAESTANRTLCAALPTLTPTFTPTNTPTATATVTPSATATATPSPTETLTPRHIVVLPLLWRSVAF